MQLKSPLTLVIVSLAIWMAGLVWTQIDPDNSNGFFVYLFGWIISLLAIGYVSTPSNSWYGKISFTGVIVMVFGVAFKILHWTGANEMIVIGILTIGCTFITMWIKEKGTS